MCPGYQRNFVGCCCGAPVALTVSAGCLSLPELFLVFKQEKKDVPSEGGQESNKFMKRAGLKLINVGGMEMVRCSCLSYLVTHVNLS